MKYTKKQRHEIYKKALKEYESFGDNTEVFLCLLFDDETELEEFMLFKPTVSDYAWFQADVGFPEEYSHPKIKNAQRTILMFCIEMTR